MRPSRFDAEPNTQNAEREYKHWKKTFEDYLEGATSDVDSFALLDRKKHHALMNSVSASVFELICDADNVAGMHGSAQELHVRASAGHTFEDDSTVWQQKGTHRIGQTIQLARRMADENKLRRATQVLFFLYKSQPITVHAMDSTNVPSITAATEVVDRSCWYLCPFLLAFESGLSTSNYLQAGVVLLVLVSVSVGVGVWVYSGSADKTTDNFNSAKIRWSIYKTNKYNIQICLLQGLDVADKCVDDGIKHWFKNSISFIS